MAIHRGFFEIGIFHPKHDVNIGTLWRSAYQLGASGIFTIGRRCKKQASDTTKTYRHVPMREYPTFENFLQNRPKASVLIGVEMDGIPLQKFSHPMTGTYLLGAEDHGLTEEVKRSCQYIVSLDSVRTNSFNVAVAGSILMYHRQFICNSFFSFV